jgi:hypothetical protein
MSRASRLVPRALLALAFVAGCASAPPPPVVEAPPPPPPPKPAPKMGMTSELGSIDEDATTKTFAGLRSSLMRCYTSGQQRIEFLSGDVKFYFRVKPDGSTHWVFLEQSTLGDRATEKCMLDIIMMARWPQPDGGEAEVHQGLGFDAPGGVRPPTDWSSDRLSAALAKASTSVNACKQHGKGTFSATAYIHPQKGGGSVLAAGAAPSTKEADADVDCLVGVLQKLKVPSPGSYAAKVFFTL